MRDGLVRVGNKVMAEQHPAGWLRKLEDAGGVSLQGFKVDALDGPAGKVYELLYWSDTSRPDYIVIDSGRWVFGHKSILAVSVIEDVDIENRRVRISLNKEQIRQTPVFLPWAT